MRGGFEEGGGKQDHGTSRLAEKGEQSITRMMNKDFLKHFDISIGISHPGPLIMNDLAPRTPFH